MNKSKQRAARQRAQRAASAPIERRFIKGGQVRAKAGDKPGIEGYAAVFNEQFDSGWFIETIKPGAFSRALKEKQDVRCLFNHDPNNLLGRTKSGTLSLKQDDSGLSYECDLNPDTRMGSEVHSMVGRGDLDGCSFSFMVTKQSWRDEKDDKGVMIYYRDIEECDLFDVGPVTFPAYPQTSVSTRAFWPDGVPAEIRSHVPALEQRDGEEMCACDCTTCLQGDCENCTNESCDDPNCKGCTARDDDEQNAWRQKAEMRLKMARTS